MAMPLPTNESGGVGGGGDNELSRDPLIFPRRNIVTLMVSQRCYIRQESPRTSLLKTSSFGTTNLP